MSADGTANATGDGTGEGTVPSWAQAWGGLAACRGLGDHFCADSLPMTSPGRAALCAPVSARPGVPEGWWCSCAMFRYGPECKEMNAAGWLMMGVYLLQLLFFAFVLRRMLRALHTLTTKRRGASNLSAGPFCLSLLCISCALEAALFVCQTLEVRPANGIRYDSARTLHVALIGALSSTTVCAFLCVALTIYDSVEGSGSGSSRLGAPARARRVVIAVNAALLLSSLAALFAGRGRVAVITFYAQVLVTAVVSLHAIHVLNNSLAEHLVLSSDQTVVGGEQLRERIVSGLQKVKTLRRTSMPFVLAFAVSTIDTLLGLDQLGQADIDSPLTVWRLWWSNALTVAIGALYLGVAVFLLGPAAYEDKYATQRARPLARVVPTARSGDVHEHEPWRNNDTVARNSALASAFR